MLGFLRLRLRAACARLRSRPAGALGNSPPRLGDGRASLHAAAKPVPKGALDAATATQAGRGQRRAMRAERHAFFRQMLEFHHGEQALVREYRL